MDDIRIIAQRDGIVKGKEQAQGKTRSQWGRSEERQRGPSLLTPSFVPRPPSLAGDPMGRSPLAVRRGPGDLYGMVPRRFLFPISFPPKEMGSRRSAKHPCPILVPPQRTFRRGACGFAVCLCKAAALSRRLRRPTFFSRRK